MTRRHFGNDAYYHMLVGKTFRREGRLPRNDPGIIPESRRTYPPFFHTILYAFGDKAEQLAFRFLSPALDAITVAFLYLVADWSGLADPLWPAIIYTLTPFNVLDASSLNPRPLANLLLCGSMVAMWSLVQTTDILIFATLWVLAVLCESLLILTNKLALQALVPLHVLATAYGFLVNADVATFVGMIILAAIMLATAMTRGEYLRMILPDHIMYLQAHLRGGHYLGSGKRIPSPLSLLKSNPVSFCAPILGLALYVMGFALSVGWFVLGWSLIILLLAQIWIWGDSWRYLQFGTFPGALIIVGGLHELLKDETLITVALCATAAALALATAIQLTRSLDKDRARMVIDTIDSLPDDWRQKLSGAKLFSNLPTYSLAYESRALVLIGNPSGEGVALNFELNRLRRQSLEDIRIFAMNRLHEKLDYYLIFNVAPSPSTDGFCPVFESARLTIFNECERKEGGIEGSCLPSRVRA